MRGARRARTSLAALGLVAMLAGCATTAKRTPPLDRVSKPPPAAVMGAVQTGEASWYGRAHHGHPTASGEVYDMYKLTAAHLTLPLGTHVRVTNLRNQRAVDVQVNDRGPYVAGRIIDLSYAAARALGAVGDGTIPVRLVVVSIPGL
jgi:rare lipoprotein A